MEARVAFPSAERNYIQHHFNNEVQMAGKDWHYGFFKRHIELSLRSLELTTVERWALLVILSPSRADR